MWGPVRFLGEYLPLEKIYKLKKLEVDEPWSPWEMTLAYAKMRGFYFPFCVIFIYLFFLYFLFAYLFSFEHVFSLDFSSLFVSPGTTL